LTVNGTETEGLFHYPEVTNWEETKQNERVKAKKKGWVDKER
jgi:hypothetical protein